MYKKTKLNLKKISNKALLNAIFMILHKYVHKYICMYLCMYIKNDKEKITNIKDTT